MNILSKKKMNKSWRKVKKKKGEGEEEVINERRN